MMTKFFTLGLVVFALAVFATPSSVEAECPYSTGYSNSYYAPSYGYSNSYYAPSYQRSYYGGGGYYGGGYNNVRNPGLRRVATAAIVAGVIVAASNSNGNRNRSRNRRH